MALLIGDGFDLYGTSGDPSALVALDWATSGINSMSLSTGRYTGKALTIMWGTLTRAFTRSGSTLILHVAIKPDGSSAGKIQFGNSSYLELDTSNHVTITYGGTAGDAHPLTNGSWNTIQLVLDSTGGATQRCYVNDILAEARVIAPAIGTSLVIDAAMGTFGEIDDLILLDGSGTAGHVRPSADVRCEALLPTSTVSNTFGGLVGAASALAALDNNPPTNNEFVYSNADAQSVRCDLGNATGTVTHIVGVVVSAVVSNRDAVAQGVNLVTNWAAGSASTKSATPGETNERIWAAYSNRGDGTAISASDLTALSLALTQT